MDKERPPLLLKSEMSVDYIFGYGSIINDESRSSTMGCDAALLNSRSGSSVQHGEGGNLHGDLSVAACVSKEFAYRSWNFRSPTGFTALGLVLSDNQGPEPPTTNIQQTTEEFCGVNGVLFPVPSEHLRAFDVREVGYYRVSVPLSMIIILSKCGCPAARERALALEETLRFHCLSPESARRDDSQPHHLRVWAYIPDSTHTAAPSEDFPILQTYLDVCIRGCLQWGGEPLAKHFLLSTTGWSDCFLNDAPLSRRPWLHRTDYREVDACLLGCAEHVKFSCRCHPEEFASLHSSSLKAGQWGLPTRNPLFTGREDFLRTLHSRLAENRGPDFSGGVRQVEVVGLGGVGKSQISVEYAHRQYSAGYYGFVAYVRAESSASVATDLRRLAFDLGILRSGGKNSDGLKEGEFDVSCDDETIAEEVKRRLYRCRYKWLLIFDNVDDPKVVSSCLPRGVEGARHGGGHVLITSRVLHREWLARGSALSLQCFQEEESVAFLRAAFNVSQAGSNVDGESASNVRDLDSLRDLARRVGHLPLALWTAGVYMTRCDVSAVEYMFRLDTLVNRAQVDESSSEIAGTISSCFSMTLDRICVESSTAQAVLPCIGFLAPDISKRMIRLLISNSRANVLKPLATQSNDIHALVDHRTESMKVSYDKEPLRIAMKDLYDSFVLFSFLTIVICCILGQFICDQLNQRDIALVLLAVFVGSYVTVLSLVITLQLRIGFLTYSREQYLHVESVLTTYNLPEHVSFNGMGGNHDLPLVKEREFSDSLLQVESDKLWEVMRDFSLLSEVRGPVSESRVGTVHRLQLAVLRQRARHSNCVGPCIEICISMLASLWEFNPSDFSSWDTAGDLVEHIEALSKHVSGEFSFSQPSSDEHRRESLLTLSRLLTGAGEFSAVVLSRFDSAQQMLESAYALQKQLIELENREDEYRNDVLLQRVADTLHILGKTLRYNGRLHDSEHSLKSALDLRRKYASNFVEDLGESGLKVADTLHELGVLHLRMHSLTTAKSFLSLSLDMKCELRYEMNCTLSDDQKCDNARQSGTHAERYTSFRSGEAATLHQLGVIATLERRYDDAESYLMEALKMMDGHDIADGRSSRSISRAATLHQLGKVELRRGNLFQAQEQLLQALDLYQKAYGERRAASHVNVAAVHHQLGATALAARDFDTACHHFSVALAARELILSESSGGRTGLCLALQALGQAEIQNKNLDRAETLFLRARSEIEIELQAVESVEPTDTTVEYSLNKLIPCGDKEDTGDFSLMGGESVLFSSQKNNLIKSLVFCIHYLKMIAKQTGDHACAELYSKEIRELKNRDTKGRKAGRNFVSRVSDDSDKKESHIHKDLSSGEVTVMTGAGLNLDKDCIVLLRHTLAIRNSVRKSCSEFRKSIKVKNVNTGNVCSADNNLTKESCGVCAEFSKLVCAVRHEITVSQIHLGNASISMERSRIPTSYLDKVIDVYEHFICDLEHATDVGGCQLSMKCCSALFNACDVVRARLGEFGISIEDS